MQLPINYQYQPDEQDGLRTSTNPRARDPHSRKFPAHHALKFRRALSIRDPLTTIAAQRRRPTTMAKEAPAKTGIAVGLNKGHVRRAVSPRGGSLLRRLREGVALPPADDGR